MNDTFLQITCGQHKFLPVDCATVDKGWVSATPVAEGPPGRAGCYSNMQISINSSTEEIQHGGPRVLYIVVDGDLLDVHYNGVQFIRIKQFGVFAC